jgi:hypothetical protein
MNDRDKKNLDFLLSASSETIRNWFEQMNVEDHEYASELMHLHKKELNKKELEVDLKIEFLNQERIELELEFLEENYKEAQQSLNKYFLKNK